MIHCGRKGKLPGAQAKTVYNPTKCVCVLALSMQVGVNSCRKGQHREQFDRNQISYFFLHECIYFFVSLNTPPYNIHSRGKWYYTSSFQFIELSNPPCVLYCTTVPMQAHITYSWTGRQGLLHTQSCLSIMLIATWWAGTLALFLTIWSGAFKSAGQLLIWSNFISFSLI